MNTNVSFMEHSSGLHVPSSLHSFDGSVAVDGAAKPVDYTVVIPEDLRSDSLAMLVPGFGAIKPTSERLQMELAEQEGMAVVCYDPLREHAEAKNTARNLANPQELHYQTIEGILEDIARNRGVRRLPNGAEVAEQGVLLLPHSMGGLPAAEFAADNSVIVDRVMYLGCVGLENALGLKIIGRGVKEIMFDVAPKVVTGKFGFKPGLATRSVKYFGSNPLRTIAEAYSCATADCREFVVKLQRLGILQSAVCFENDLFFRPEDTEEGIGYIIGFDNIHTMKNADHTAPQAEPLRTSRFIGQVLHPEISLEAAA